MIGWIMALFFYCLGWLIVFKCSNDNAVLRAFLWPFLVVGLAISGLLILASTPRRIL
jgi:hypothetical protein